MTTFEILDLLHNGHVFEPGIDQDFPELRDPRWCNHCGEQVTGPLRVIPEGAVAKMDTLLEAAQDLPDHPLHTHGEVLAWLRTRAREQIQESSAHQPEVDALDVEMALRILAPGNSDDVTLGEIRQDLANAKSRREMSLNAPGDDPRGRTVGREGM